MKIYNKIGKFLLAVVLFIFSFIACSVCLLGLFYFSDREFFGLIGLDQLLFHLLLISSVDINKYLLLGSLFLIILIFILMIMVIKRPQMWLKLYSTSATAWINTHKKATSFITSLICLLLGVFLIYDPIYNVPLLKLFSQVGVLRNSIHNRSIKDNIYEKYFIDAKGVDFKINTPKNIILILAESLESSFSDEEIFGENMIYSLQKQKGKSIIGYSKMPGTEWTVASQLSVLCGIPFKYSQIYWKNVKNDKFFPNLMCLPEILNNLGYNTYYLSGTSAHFAYTDLFLSQHGLADYEDFPRLHRKEYFKNLPTYNSNQYIGDTLYDSALLEYFKEKIKTADTDEKPFLAIIMTINTHFPFGKNEPFCENKYNDIRDAVICSSNIIADFVDWFKKQEFNRDTSLLILGDHPMMTSNIQKLLDKLPNRQAANFIWSSSVPADIHRDFAQFDWMPTILEISGITWNGHRMGIGTSLLSDEQTLLQIFGDDLSDILEHDSDLYKSFFDD